MRTQILDERFTLKDVKIRKAKSADIDAMVSLLCELFSIEADFCFDEELQRKGLMMMLEGGKDQRRVHVAELGGKVVGMCTAQTLVSTAEGSVVAMVEDMVVTSCYKNKGIGGKLLKSIEEWAGKIGAKRLQLLADRMNFNALIFYDKNGWLPTQLICLRKK